MMNKQSESFHESIAKAEKIVIGGHINPDGDCIGSCMALSGYIKKCFKNKTVDVFLQFIPESFMFLAGADKVTAFPEAGAHYDLFIALDCGDAQRLGDLESVFDECDEKVVVDHHMTNTGYGKLCIVKPDASSTCELLCDLMHEEDIDSDIAQALYLGIVHDTGVFKHSSTTRHTMEVAGMLMDKGVDPAKIIDGTFYEKTYLQNQILGRCLMESILLFDGKVIISVINRRVKEFYNLTPSDTDGIIDEMRVTKGVEVAMLLREDNQNEWKVSMRSRYVADVGKICAMFGGGGHIRAAGCTIRGSVYDAINSLTPYIEEQLNAHEEQYA